MALGANSLSMHRVARLTKFIVIIGVRKSGRRISRDDGQHRRRSG